MNLKIISNWIKLLEAPCHVISIPLNCFYNADNLHRDLPVEQIFAFLCMLKEMDDPFIMDYLYVSKSKDYSKIKSRHPSLWSKAHELANGITNKMEYRKSLYFANGNQRCQLLYRNPYFINASFIAKENRWCPNILNPGVAHGMPIVNGSKVKIEPKYRIKHKYPDVIPVYIDQSEL